MSSVESDKKVSYFNTLMFTIIAGVLSLILVVMLFFKFGKTIMWFIITCEIGIFTIITFCIYKIVTFEKAKEAERRSNKYVVTFNQCPDYFTKRVDTNGGTVCVNEYSVEDPRGQNYIARVYPSNTPAGVQVLAPPSMYNPSSNIASYTDGYEMVGLNNIDVHPRYKSTEDKCKLFFAPPPDASTAEKYYPYLPWSAMTSRCEGFLK